MIAFMAPNPVGRFDRVARIVGGRLEEATP